jgi:hypothetical protein
MAAREGRYESMWLITCNRIALVVSYRLENKLEVFSTPWLRMLHTHARARARHRLSVLMAKPSRRGDKTPCILNFGTMTVTAKPSRRGDKTPCILNFGTMTVVKSHASVLVKQPPKSSYWSLCIKQRRQIPFPSVTVRHNPYVASNSKIYIHTHTRNSGLLGCYAEYLDYRLRAFRRNVPPSSSGVESF